MTNRRVGWPNLVIALSLLLSTIWIGPGAPVQAEEPSLSAEEKVLQDAAKALGWPPAVDKRRLVQTGSDSEVMFMLWPPNSAVRYFAQPVYSITNGGSYEEETIQYLRVLNLGEKGSREFIDKLIENGFVHSSYQGREAVILRHGDEICDAGGLLGYILELLREIIRKFIEALIEEGWEGEFSDEPLCATADAGMIIWTCGSYVFVARDDTGTGAEDQMAAALFMAAQRQSLCDLGDTLVILAGTADQPGSQPLATYEDIAQTVNSYYGQNAYGRVLLTYTFMDADGDAGSSDWYNVGPTMAAYVGRERDFATAAVKKAFEQGAPRDELNLARVIVVYAGPSKQADAANGKLSTLCCWPSNGRWFDIEVGQGESKAHVFAGSLIMVAEKDGLGLWAHEVGHSLYSHNVLWTKYYYISDRYNYEQPWGKYGNINNWGLMGAGNWWGDPLASAPVHMSGFTKESAEWLSYKNAELGKNYSLGAVELLNAGDTVLRVDDPTSADPRRFFILEARDSQAHFGAPESGVVLYQVTWDRTHNHHIVNAITPQMGGKVGSGTGGRRYLRPTFRGAGEANTPTTFRWPAGKLEWTLESESTASGYTAVMVTNVYTPANQVGAVVAPAGPPAVPPPANNLNSTGAGDVYCGPDAVQPDIDLHAYDDQGRHVGLNYDTQEYEVEIPGADFSGDLKDAAEWIYVPEGTKVRFEVSSEKTAQFLRLNPQYKETIRPERYETRYQKIDENGAITEAKGDKGEIKAGAEAKLEGPDAPGLDYRPVRSPGYGNNLPENLALAALIAAIVAMGLIAWVVVLVRR